MLQIWKFKKTEPTPLQMEIKRLHEALKDMEAHENNYALTLDQLLKLEKLSMEINSKTKPSPDTLVNGAVNLAGILFILNFEHAHVFASKAASFVKKLH